MFSKSLTCLNSDHVHDYHRVRSILYTGKIQKTVRKFELPHLIFQSTHKTASQLHRLKPLCSYFSDHAVLELGLAFFSFAWFLNNNRELHFTIFSLSVTYCALCLINLARRISLCGPLNSEVCLNWNISPLTKPRDIINILQNFFFPVRTVSYGTLLFPLEFKASALSASL